MNRTVNICLYHIYIFIYIFFFFDAIMKLIQVMLFISSICDHVQYAN